MYKRGQFYIVAAVIIVMVIVGIASVRNYANIKPEPRKIKDIGSELSNEGARIVDYGIYSRENVTEILNNFTDSDFAPYFLKKTDSTNIVFVYGDKNGLYSVQYNNHYTGSVYATIGGVSPAWQSYDVIANRTKVNVAGEKVDVEILGRTYEFDVKENEMFYFLITQQNDDETYIERN
jgi:hypothetical protein